MKNSLCLVTGATGVIGPGLVRALLARGHRVRALVRRDVKPGELPAEIEIVNGDLNDEKALARAVRDVDVGFHLAAKLHVNDPDPSLVDEYRRVNVEGTRQLLAAARSAKVRRVVYFGSICVYGPSARGQLLDEESPIAPDTIYAQTKAAAEELVLTARRGDTDEPMGVVLRLAAVYGSHMKGNYPRLVSAIRKHRFRHIGSGDNRRTLVHVEDVIQASLLAAEHSTAPGRLFNVTDGSVHTMREIVDAICAALKIKPPRLSVPELPVRLAAGAAEVVFRIAGRTAPVNRASLNKLLEDVAVSGARLQTELGFQPKVPLSEGWREAVK